MNKLVFTEFRSVLCDRALLDFESRFTYFKPKSLRTNIRLNESLFGQPSLSLVKPEGVWL